MWRVVAGDPSAQCLRHGFMLHTKYQVVYPFPTFQPAFQLKKDQVVLLNTSYSLVACAVSVHSAGRPLADESTACRVRLRACDLPTPKLVASPPKSVLSLPHITDEGEDPRPWSHSRKWECE